MQKHSPEWSTLFLTVKIKKMEEGKEKKTTSSLHTFWELFNDSYSLETFRKFLIKRHCEENLFFWLDVQKYKLEPEDTNLLSEANKIMEKYFEDHSPYQLNVDAADVKKLRTNLSSSSSSPSSPSRTLFDDTQRFCFQLMINDTIPKFLLSQEYKFSFFSFFLLFIIVHNCL